MNSVVTKEQVGSARFQSALARRSQATPPIWLMRQAGRYHKHYQALREKYSFMDLCKQPELAAEVALGPVLDFDQRSLVSTGSFGHGTGIHGSRATTRMED